MHGRTGRARRKIEEQAVLRLIALGDDPTGDAAMSAYGWVARDPAHAVAFARAEMAWEEAARLKSDKAHQAVRTLRD